MASSGPDPVGVLVVRVWNDGDPEISLRARITRTLDITSGEQDVSTTANVDEIPSTVRRWLEEFVVALATCWT